MIYLGNKTDVQIEFAEKAENWLSVRILKKERKDSKLNQQFKNLFTENIISELISSKPDALCKLYKKLYKDYTPPSKEKINSFNSQSTELFVKRGYKGWFLDKKVNYWLAEALDIHTCTYCNREYIFVLKNAKGGKGMIPQFDHWFPKNRFPLFALSFYNLIPSCATCNGIKSKIVMNLKQHFHPYLDANISDSYKFSIWLKSISEPRVFLKADSELLPKSNNTLDALNLSMIYKEHSSRELRDLYDLRYKYSENYLDVLLNKMFADLTITEREKYRLIFGTEIEVQEYHKRIMSKFKKDIISFLLES